MVLVAIAAASPAALGTPDALLPDLQPLPSTEFRLKEFSNGTVQLRFSTWIANAGPGALELLPRLRDCDGDGDRSNDRTAIQRVYTDIDADGVYTRKIDRIRETFPVGCFRFHATHDHWHFVDFARYELRSVDDGSLVSHNGKVGFCLVDSVRKLPATPGAPPGGYYGACSADAVQGLSAGWADVYQYSLPGQSLEVTGVGPGEYCVVTTVDPAARLLEMSAADNTGRQLIRIKASGDVARLSTPC
ncbi:MAG: lysyl oxidase family protein [Actinomycetota bacterium]